MNVPHRSSSLAATAERTAHRFLILLPLLLAACTSHRLLPGTTYTPHAGKQRVENTTAGVSVVYYGDYVFHQPRKRHYPFTDRAWLRSQLKPKEARAFLAAHTTIEPYGATLGLVHASGSPVERADAVRSMEGIGNLREEEQQLGGTRWQVLSYTLGDLTYREYLTAKGDGSVRLLFWTTPDQAAWLERESLPIVESYVGM